MPLSTPNLDDLRFQQNLVDEARKRIIRYCPEWTEYNVSDPGITIIELFAWMTELLAYRLNRVPEKNYLSFLYLLGFQRRPASSARTDLTFWLSTPLPISADETQDVVVPVGLEVRTNTGEPDEVIFSTDRELRITPPVQTQLLKEGQPNRNYLARLGLEIFYPFNQQRPRSGDAFYLGFDAKKDLSGHILQFSFTTEPTEAVGIRREDPPWVWECSTGNGMWQEVNPSNFRGERDTTGGLNNPQGSLVLYLPLQARPDLVYGREAYWVRCRLEQRSAGQGMYTESPRVTSINVKSLGASVPATHARVVRKEQLGKSNGEPGQQFKLLNAPVLELAEGETLMVEEFQGFESGGQGEYIQKPWQLVKDFSNSTPYDRHFTLDAAGGLVQLGPAVRQPDGVVRQYGRIPESGRSLVFRSYRYGGGARGNLPPNSLLTMMSTIAYIARVTNLTRAEGGMDQESMDEVQLRAQRELQAQNRAVTAQDYEQFVLSFSRSVARVKCLAPGIENDNCQTGQVKVLIVPSVANALQAGDLTMLQLNNEFVKGLTRHLDQYRLLTTTLQISEPEYIGVKVVAELVISDFSSSDVVLDRVNRTLKNMLNPLPPYPMSEPVNGVGGDIPLIEPGWNGWPWGRDLFIAEVHALLQRVPGVKYVLDVKVFHRPVEPQLENVSNYVPAELVQLTDKALWVKRDTLLVSLGHEISSQVQSEFEAKYEVD